MTVNVAATGSRVKTLKILSLMGLGGVLEFYDFIIYALFAGYISATFFPGSDQVTALLETFAVFSIGYVVRPVGGIIFGHFGDRFGRKRVFTVSILLMAISTLFIAFVPSYASWGIAAPIILTIFRIIQGLSVGGEIPGAVTFVSEIMPERRGLGCGFVFFSLILGIVIGSLVHLLLSHLISMNLLGPWGWRIAFVIGGVFGILGYFMRRALYESPSFMALQDKIAKVPALILLKNDFRSVVSGWLITSMVAVSVTLFFLFGPIYLTKLLHYPSPPVFWGNIIALFIVSVLCIVVGMLIDYRGKRIVLAVMIILILLVALPFYQAQIDHRLPFMLQVMIPALLMAGVTGIVPVLLAELFPTEVRYSGVGLVYNLGFATFGGLTPVIVMALIDGTKNLMMPAYYLVAVCCIGLIGVLLVPKQRYFD